MATIDIPAWLQYTALGLVIAYAALEALRAVVVAANYVSCLIRKEWPMRTTTTSRRCTRPRFAEPSAGSLTISSLGPSATSATGAQGERTSERRGCANTRGNEAACWSRQWLNSIFAG